MTSTTLPRRSGRPIPPRLIYILAAVALVVVGVAWLALRPHAPKDPFRTAAVERGNLTRSVSASGTLQALVTVQVGSQVSGQIKQVLVDFNSPVKRGDTLAIIDPDTYQSRVRQAEADLTASNATLNQQTSTLRQAEAQAAVDLASYNRTKTLTERGYSAPQALDTAEAQYKRSLAGVGAARAAVAVQQARITQSQAALHSSQLDLGRTRILSPIDGVVVNRAIDPGATVQASFQTPNLFQIAQDLSKLQVKILVDEADIGQVREGQAVKFTVDAFPDQTFAGVVTQVRKQPETQANVVAYEVIAEADNPRGQLLPGMTANADILIEERQQVLKVPNAALRFKPADQREGPRVGFGPPGAGPPGGGPGGARPGGAGGAFSKEARERLYAEVGLTDDQRKQAVAIQEEARGKIMGAAGDQSAMRQIIDDSRKRFEALLTPAQRVKYDAFQKDLADAAQGRRTAARLGTVYVLRDKAPAAVYVHVGASDGTFTEVTGELKAGDQVIVGGGPQPKPGMPGGQRR